MMLLYIHVPFCQKKCSYCAFFSMPLTSDIESFSQSIAISQYTDSVCKEIAKAKKVFPYQKKSLSSIFFGGGTPSVLSVKSISSLLEQIAIFFDIHNDAEISIEVNPESALRGNWLKEIRSLGVNRLSMGAQSFFDDELELLGRVHSVAQVEQCVEKAREADFCNINIDLMYGIPSFTKSIPLKGTERWLFALDRVVQLKPEHISTYSLTVEDDTPLFHAFSERSLFSPDEEVEREMYFQGIDLLASHGYYQYELSNFSLPTFECAHNLGYWQGKEYFGVGPSAVSSYGGKRYTNKANLQKWIKGLSCEDSYGQDIEDLSPEIVLKEMLMLALRTTQGLNINAWRNQGGGDVLSVCNPLISALMEQNLIIVEHNYLSLTQKGLFVSNEIISRFFEENIF